MKKTKSLCILSPSPAGVVSNFPFISSCFYVRAATGPLSGRGAITRRKLVFHRRTGVLILRREAMLAILEHLYSLAISYCFARKTITICLTQLNRNNTKTGLNKSTTESVAELQV